MKNYPSIRHLNIFLTFLVLLLSGNTCMIAQTNEDKKLLEVTSFKEEKWEERTVQYGFSENKKKTYNPIYHILSLSMYLYQRTVSPQLSRGCAFTPSCSAYSKELIKEYGIIKGVFCTTDRLMRCNRIALADKSFTLFDPHDHKIHEDTHRYHRSKTK